MNKINLNIAPEHEKSLVYIANKVNSEILTKNPAGQTFSAEEFLYYKINELLDQFNNIRLNDFLAFPENQKLVKDIFESTPQKIDKIKDILKNSKCKQVI